MTQLVILVVVAAWLAVLIPPMLRSRVENRPNSSVTDFRRQLDRLSHTSTNRPNVRAIGRPLAPSGVGRSSRMARSDRPMLRSGVTAPKRASEPELIPSDLELEQHDSGQPVRAGGGRYRSHGDPTGGQGRPLADQPTPTAHPTPQRAISSQRREHTAPHGMGRPIETMRRRRINVLFLLLAVTAATLFLAATTDSSVMFYSFALSFLALVGYVYLLAQINQRATSSYDGWLDR